MTQSKKTTNAEKLKGFARYVQLEQFVSAELENPDPYLVTDILSVRSRNKEHDKHTFAESNGAVKLYSITELQYLFKNARRIFGDDRDHLVKEILFELSKKKNRRNLAGSPADADLQLLRLNFPNFSEAIDQIEFAAALSNLSNQQWFQMSPLLLLGEAGVGKTAFAQAFAKLLGVYFKRIDVGTATTGAIFSGLSLGWGSGHTGEIFKTINESETANPLILLDEVDKMSRGSSYPVEPILLSLLEKESAESFREEAVQLHFNCKHFLWVATANNLDAMSEPLKSRFNIVNVRAPNAVETQQIIRSIYRKIRANNPWGICFKSEISDSVIEALVSYSPRELTRILQIAFGKAAKRGGKEICTGDLQVNKKLVTKTIGFL